MSKNLKLKRVALVAISAMGLGMLGIAPASAAANRALANVTVTNPTRDVAVGAAGTSTFSVTVGAAALLTAATDTAKVQLVLSVPAGSSVTLANLDGVGGGDVYSNAALSAEFATGVYNTAIVTLTVDNADIAVAAVELAGTVSIAPDVAGTYTLTIIPLEADGTTQATSGTTFTVTRQGPGTPTVPIFLDEATTTVNVASLGAVALDAATSATAPGMSYDSGLITGSVTKLTVPATTAIVFGVTASGSAFGTNDLFDLSLNGTIVATAIGDAAITSDNLTYTPAATAAGTYSANIRVFVTGTTRAAATGTFDIPFTLVVTAPSKFSTGASTAYIRSASGNSAATSATDILSASGSSTKETANKGAITMTFNNASGGAMASGNTLTAQITNGPGYLVLLTADTPTATQCVVDPTFNATVGRAISAQTVDAVSNLIICADGTVGESTIKLSVTNQLATTEWTTKTFTFYGPVRTLTTTVNASIGVAGGDTTGYGGASRTSTGEVTNPGVLATGNTTPAIIISAKDAAGQLATAAAAPIVISSNLASVSGGTCTLDDGATTYSSSIGVGVYNCNFTTTLASKSGDKATLTFRIADPLGTDGVDYLTTTVDVTVGGARFTETLSLDKASYNAGEAMVVTRTAKDSAGNPVADGSSAPAVVFNKAIGGSTPGAGFYYGGTLVTSATRPAVFAPTAAGVFEARITGYDGSTATSAIIATATVGDDTATAAANAASDAASEAIDAANAATDAANLAAEAADAATVAAEEARDAADAATAAVEALATEVATLMAALKAQITTLANVVAKIAKRTKS